MSPLTSPLLGSALVKLAPANHKQKLESTCAEGGLLMNIMWLSWQSLGWSLRGERPLEQRQVIAAEGPSTEHWATQLHVKEISHALSSRPQGQARQLRSAPQTSTLKSERSLVLSCASLQDKNRWIWGKVGYVALTLSLCLIAPASGIFQPCFYCLFSLLVLLLLFMLPYLLAYLIIYVICWVWLAKKKLKKTFQGSIGRKQREHLRRKCPLARLVWFPPLLGQCPGILT